jgi:Tol biopolymer transport system component
MPRTLRPGQRSELYVVDVSTGDRRLVHSSATVLFEAPNWTSDGRLLVNGDGRLFETTPTRLTEIDLQGVPPINNDHVLGPDGTTIYVSADDGPLYAVPLEGGGAPRRVTNDRGPGFHHYLHGVSPDGRTLAYIGLEQVGDRRVTNIWTIPAAGGTDVQVTNDEHADDGSEYSPDGKWIYFNSERASTAPGHAQLFRIAVSTGEVEQLTFDERVNWFPAPGAGRLRDRVRQLPTRRPGSSRGRGRRTPAPPEPRG